EYAEMIVPAVGKVLDISIIPEETTYEPGDQAVFDIHVSDYAGRPVQAELSLALVDEAIYALSEDLSPPLFEAFYGERPLEILERHTLHVMGYLLYDLGGMGGGGGGPMFANPRSDFPDTAVWIPTLVTNSQGDARLEITLPDNLTTWRLTARAVTLDHLVGETIESIVTQQPLVLRPHLPRILTEGDQFELVATLHNYTDEDLEVEVGLSATGFNMAGVDKQTVTVPANGTFDVIWNLTAQAAGEASLTFTADGGDVRDAVQLSLPIRSLAIRDVQILSGQIEGNGMLNFDVPKDALQNSSLRIQLSTSVTGGLLDGLEYLTGFPYGCVEQTMSAVLPNAVIGRAFDQLGVQQAGIQSDLLIKVNMGLQRLYGMQHQDGGWGWWYDDATHDYQTAWVVFGLAMTREAGFEVDENAIERGAAWLQENLNEMNLRTRAYALYTLSVAGYGQAAQAEALYNQRFSLDPFSQAALAMALQLEGREEQAATIVDELYQSVETSGDQAYWDIGIQDGYYRKKTMASAVRTTALILSAMTRIGEYEADELEPIAHWLMSQRGSHGWGTTNETSFAILGLTDYLLQTIRSDAGGAYQVNLNGDDLGHGEFEIGATSVEFEVPSDGLLSGQNEISLDYSGSDSMYYLVTRTSLLPRAEVEPAGLLEIERRYVDPSTQRPLTSFEPGDLVEVQLSFSLSETMTYLIIEDHLPGGLEALNERLNNVSHVSSPESDFYEGYSPFFFWMDFGYNYKEIRADRVSFFVSELEPGEYTYTYMVRVTHSGTFSAPPAEVYAMYNLDQWGRSASTIVEIE
ncbi:MAG: alpha-2-macroglobulin family protein, partial [Anaerolineales bacterium]